MSADPSSSTRVLCDLEQTTSRGLGFLTCEMGLLLVPAWLCRGDSARHACPARWYLDCGRSRVADVLVVRCLSWGFIPEAQRDPVAKV